jgi:hypothetical protein
VGTCWRQNKSPKVKVAVKGNKLDLIEDWLVMCYQDMSMCSKGSAPLLVRWRILERAAYLLRGGTPLPHLCSTSGKLWSVGRGGSLFPHTWQPFTYTWCALPLHVVRPPSLGTPPICYILKHSLLLQVS